MKHLFYVFFIAMVPLIELRGAIPIGVGFGIPWELNLLICSLGNCIPVPFILFFVKAVLKWMRGCRIGIFAKISNRLYEKAERNRGKVEKYAAWGLYIFVAIPLPGTGAWTGALVAALFDMNKTRAIISIVAGVVTAGLIMTVGSHLVAAVIALF